LNLKRESDVKFTFPSDLLGSPLSIRLYPDFNPFGHAGDNNEAGTNRPVTGATKGNRDLKLDTDRDRDIAA